MKIKAYAKVNLSLKVEPIDKNGLHKIESKISIVKNFYDVIKIKKRKEKIDVIFSNYKDLEKQNFIYRVLEILREENQIEDFYQIKLKKRIPVGSGLGGGTSDAIAVYKTLVKQRSKELDEKIASVVGFDSYFFLSEYDTAMVTGYGEILEPCPAILILKKNLILSNIVCETRKVYELFDKIGFNEDDQNQLTKSALQLYPELKTVAKFGVMSGSGSTFVKNIVNKN